MFALLLFVSNAVATTPEVHVTGTERVTPPVPHPQVAIVIAKQHMAPHTTLTLERSFLQSVVVSAQQKPF